MKNIKVSPYTPTEIEIEEVAENRVKISAYPYEAGYAITVAHPLRRLLLSSTVGYSIIALQIEGATHEFDTIRGVMEDVALFIVNLKNCRFKLRDDAQLVTIEYSFTGPLNLCGKDLENSEIDVVTQDAHIATINSDGALKFSIIISKGIGYLPSEEIRGIIPENFIPIDAYFTPVKKAIYSIENMLVEDNPNFEKIVFDITTDGQISPKEAFSNSLISLHKQLLVFNNEFGIDAYQESEESVDQPEVKMLMQKIETLNLSARSFNCLDRSGIGYIAELVLMSENDLKEVKNLGKKSYDEIKDKLQEIGYPLESEKSEQLISSLKRKLDKIK